MGCVCRNVIGLLLKVTQRADACLVDSQRNIKEMGLHVFVEKRKGFPVCLDVRGLGAGKKSQPASSAITISPYPRCDSFLEYSRA